MFETRLYGRVAVARALRPHQAEHQGQELLFLATERGQFSLLAYDRGEGGVKVRMRACEWGMCM